MHRRRFLATLAATPIAAAVALRAAPAAAVAADSPDIAGLGYFVNDGTIAPTYQGIPRDVWAMQDRMNFLERHRLDGIVAHPPIRFVYPRYLGTIRSLPS